MADETTTTAVVTRDPNTYVALQTSAATLRASGLFPALKSDAAAYAIVQYGHELGVGPMMALQNISLIQGKPVCNGQLMLSLAVYAGVRHKTIESTGQRCTIEFCRFGNVESVSFTMDDATTAGLAGKANWKNYPQEMLYWRCVAKGCRRISPDAIMGLYTPDEITDGDMTAFSDAAPAAAAQPTPNVPVLEKQMKATKSGLCAFCRKRHLEAGDDIGLVRHDGKELWGASDCFEAYCSTLQEGPTLQGELNKQDKKKTEKIVNDAFDHASKQK